MHGTGIEEVHFHDVGAVDAIVDVTGARDRACICSASRACTSRRCRSGGGFVDGPHGRMPVPGPGAAELLRGFPVVDTGVRSELVTPTGAAILTTLAASGAGRMPAMTVDRDRLRRGHQGPSRHPQRPALLRRRDRGRRRDRDRRPARNHHRRHESPALRTPDGSALRGRCPRRVPHPRHHEAQPPRHRSHRAVPHATRFPISPASSSKSPRTIGVRWTEVSRTRLDREMVTIVTDYGPLPFKVSRLGRSRRHGHPGVRRRRPSRPGQIPAGARSPVPSPRRRPPPPDPLDPAPGGGGPSRAPHVGRLTVRPSSLRLSPRKHLSAQN